MRPFALAAGLAAGVGAALLVLRRLDAVEVSGASMAPALLPGDRLLVESFTYARRRPRVGEVVLAADPRLPERELVKRVANVTDDAIHLRGDHPAQSTDSRAFGAVPGGAVRWRVALRFWPPLRAGGIGSARGLGGPWLAGAEVKAVDPPDELGGEAACAAFGDLVVGAD
jgi:nickel-type superoxide dismutase maturation protease